MTKLVFLADTHNYTITNVPDGDFVIHCGDATGLGTIPEVAKFMTWYGQLPHRHKIFVAGNHDWLFQKEPNLARQICRDNDVLYLEDQGRTLEGIRLYGTPWQPNFMDWAFNLDELDLEERFQHIPGGLDVLITHGPPFGILDETTHDFKLGNMGCRALRERVDRAKPRVHVFGHCHKGYGQKQTPDTLFINAANCTERYNATNPPVVIDLEPR